VLICPSLELLTDVHQYIVLQNIIWWTIHDGPDILYLPLFRGESKIVIAFLSIKTILILILFYNFAKTIITFGLFVQDVSEMYVHVSYVVAFIITVSQLYIVFVYINIKSNDSLSNDISQQNHTRM